MKDAASTHVTQLIRAPRPAVYQALLDPHAIGIWRVPAGMSSFVHEFDARAEGRFRVSLTYDAPTAAGKTTPRTDTYHGRFVELVPNERVVEVIEFETSDPELAGVMTVTTMLVDAAEGGTELHATHANLPPGLSPTANEAGWRESLGKLAAFMEAQEKGPRQMNAQDQAVARDASREEVITRVLDAPREHVWRAQGIHQ